MLNDFNPWGLINQKLRVAHLHTVDGRSGDDVIHKLLRVISVQVAGGGLRALIAWESQPLVSVTCRRRAVPEV